MNDLVHFTATELVPKMHNSELGAVEVFNAHAGVIEATNPDVNALVTLCLERAFDEAKLADKRVSSDDVHGPLHGLPYAVKDTLPTKDVRTTYGLLIFENRIPQQDALHVERALTYVSAKRTVPERRRYCRG